MNTTSPHRPSLLAHDNPPSFFELLDEGVFDHPLFSDEIGDKARNALEDWVTDHTVASEVMEAAHEREIDEVSQQAEGSSNDFEPELENFFVSNGAIFEVFLYYTIAVWREEISPEDIILLCYRAGPDWIAQKIRENSIWSPEEDAIYEDGDEDIEEIDG